MREYLLKIIKAKEAQIENIRNQIKVGKTADEVRALGDTLKALLSELADAKEQLENVDDGNDNEDDNSDDGNKSNTGEDEEQGERSLVNGQFMRSLGSYNLNSNQAEKRDSDPYGSLEYRKAFKNYVQRGTPIPSKFIKRAGGDEGTTVTDEIGAIIPTTVMQELIKDVSKVYGQIYDKVRKVSIKGGVQFPISKLDAKVKWIGETEVSKRQKAGDIKEFVTFGYHQAEIRISVTLLAMTVSLEIFESEISKLIAEAYVRAMDTCIISGTGVGQPLGITKDPRVKNVIEFSETDISNWESWRKNLFSKVPLSKRGQGEFLFTNSTVESNLLTMKDKNDRPLFREATDLQLGESSITGTFFGRGVTLVEPDILADFDTAESGDVIGIYWIPNDYAVNTNLQFNVHRYFDEESNEWVTKGLTIVDGKILDTSGCYIIKKKA